MNAPDRDELGSVVKGEHDGFIFEARFEGPPRTTSPPPTGNLTVAPSSEPFVMSPPSLLNKSSIPPLLSDDLPPGLSDDLPPGLSDEHLDLPAPPTMSNINPFTFVSVTDAMAKDRAGRRDRPVLRHAGPSQVDDRQDPYEAILLGPGENKIDVEIDTRLPSAAIFTFHKEDHTLGNMLRTRLLKTEHVIFAAYKIPHPLTPNFLLRVQTDGEITPRAAVINASKALIGDLGILSREFTKEFELRKMANAANQQQNPE